MTLDEYVVLNIVTIVGETHAPNTPTENCHDKTPHGAKKTNTIKTFKEKSAKLAPHKASRTDKYVAEKNFDISREPIMWNTSYASMGIDPQKTRLNLWPTSQDTLSANIGVK